MFKVGDDAILHDKNCDFKVIVKSVFTLHGETYCQVAPREFEAFTREVNVKQLSK
ncbi:hypothetical protein ACWG0P_08990 [Amedibacillus sp. YH-ame6]